MFCRKCGESLTDDTVYCPYCGTKIVAPSFTDDKSKTDTAPNDTEVTILPANQVQDNNVIPMEEPQANNDSQTSKNELLWYIIFCVIAVVLSATIAGNFIITMLLFACGSSGLALTKSLWKTNKIKAVVAFLVGLISVCIMLVAMSINHGRRHNL